jgi:N4-gp56 family major capsid protein
MGDWTFTTASPLARQSWASKWWKEAQEESYWYGMGAVGRSEENDIIVEFPELEREQGWKHWFGQVRNLSGSGIQGDATMEGNEEEPDVYDDAITIDQYRNAVRTKGKLSDQYPSDKGVRTWAKMLLKRWKAEKIDQDIFDGLGTSCTKILYGGDATSTATIESGDYMTLQLIGKAAAYAEKATPEIVGKSKGGEKKWLCVMSIDQAYDIMERDAAWAQAQREAMARGPGNKVFKNTLGAWRDTELTKHRKVALSTNWGAGANLNGASALFCGVQAGGIAYAKRKVWNEKTFDYGNKVGFCIGAIWGFTKAVFNSADNAVVQIRTFRTSN